MHEQQLIEMGRPNAFIRKPYPTKKEWDAIQGLHPKILVCTVPVCPNLSGDDTEAVAQLMGDICWHGQHKVPVYLKIQKFHADKLKEHLDAGKEATDFKCRIRKRLLNKMIMPTNRLMYKLDPKCTRSVDDVHAALMPYFSEYQAFLRQHEDRYKDVVGQWDLPKYLDVMESMVVVTRIEKSDESWGELKFKCSCKFCFVRCCCRENLIWSMVLNPKLVMPPKYAKLEPSERKKKGRPTEKRLKDAAVEPIDARAFVDKAPPRVNNVYVVTPGCGSDCFAAGGDARSGNGLGS
jgi:hypothetical protein